MPTPGPTAPKHTKARDFCGRLMEGDATVWEDTFSPGAAIYQWFGKAAGKAQSVAQMKAGTQASRMGPLRYYNRKQYYGADCVVETHTVSWDPERGHKMLAGKTTEAVMLWSGLDEHGLASRMDEYLDPGFISAGPRPIPAPATPPGTINQPAGGQAGGHEHGIATARALFDAIEGGGDVWPMIEEGATATQFMASTGGKPRKLVPGKDGRLVLTVSNVRYTNRRQFAGRGFAVELHTVTLDMGKKKQRYTLEVAVLLRLHPTTGHVVALEEYMDPATSSKAEAAKL